jgi:thioredoxin-like negative regulator of GroEL
MLPASSAAPLPSWGARRSSSTVRPHSAAELRRSAQQALELGHCSDAADLLARAVALRPGDSVWRLRWAEALEAAGRTAESAEVASSLDPTLSPAAAHLLARLAERQGGADASVPRWSEHLHNAPADVHARVARARALRERGEWDLALSELEVAGRQDRFHVEALVEQVELHLEQGRVQQATRPLRRLRRLVADGPRSRPALARVQLAMGAPTAAGRALDEHPQPPPVLAAEIAAARGDHEQAHALLEAAPISPARALLCGRLLLFQGDLRGARQEASEGLAQRCSAAHRARLLHLLGDIEDEADRPAAAAAAWRAANHSWGAPGTVRPAREQMNAVMRAMDRDGLGWLPRRREGGAGVVVVVGAPGSGVQLCASILGGDPGLRLRVPSVRLSELPHQLTRPGGRPWLQALHRVRPSTLDHLARRYLGTHSDQAMLVDADVDALPYVGLLHLLLPEARVVVVERQPQDQLLSLWRRPHPQPDRAWSRSPTAARRWLNLQRAMVDHWARTLPTVVTRVSYEELLLDPRATLAPLRDSLGRPAPTLPAEGCVRPQRQDGPTLRLDHIGRGERYTDWIGQA